MEISTRIRDKGDRLVRENRVGPLDQEQGRYEVRGDHGIYKVTVVDSEQALGWCNCFAVTIPCSHLYAASVYQMAHPVERRLRLVSPAGRDLTDPFDFLPNKGYD